MANLESFDVDRSISLVPPEGEFALLNYRTSTAGFKPPFRLQATLEPDPASQQKALLTLRLWCARAAFWRGLSMPCVCAA